MAVTIDDLKRHLVIEHDDDDVELAMMLSHARNYCETVGAKITVWNQQYEGLFDRATLLMAGRFYSDREGLVSPARTALDDAVFSLLAPMREAVK